jgi:hypothetical protein
LKAVNKGLDEFFKKTLEGYQERTTAITDFRLVIEKTLVDIARDKARKLPMFIFVDELDRCRPSFAISLLEGIKHLFGVKGVCFVVSTNMAQLSESVKAVYGSGFDGYQYLKRFFEVEFTLPIQHRPRYAQVLINDYLPSIRRSVVSGMPRPQPGAEESLEAALVSWVAETFELDLRAQRQMLEMATAAAAGIEEGRPVYLMWLLALCALRHRGPSYLDEIALVTTATNSKITDIFQRAGAKPVRRVAKHLHREGREVLEEITFVECCRVYHVAADQSLVKTHEDRMGINSYDYPANLIVPIADEMPSQYTRGKFYKASLASYVELVRNAGHLLVDFSERDSAA